MFSNNSWQYDLLLCFRPGVGTKGLSLDFPFHIWDQGCISVRIESCNQMALGQVLIPAALLGATLSSSPCDKVQVPVC